MGEYTDPPLPPPTGMGDRMIPDADKAAADKLESVAKLSFRAWLWLQHHQDSEFAPLARFILSGGPDNIFVNKPLKSAQVQFELAQMYATGQGRPALSAKIIKLSKKAVIAYREDDHTIEDLMVQREAEEKAAETFIRELESEVLKTSLEESGLVPDVRRSGTHVMTGEGGLPRVLCTYLGAHGKGCNRIAVPGVERCDIHGGMYLDPEDIKGILARGQEKIVAASDIAIEAVIDMIQNSTQDAIRLKAAEMIMDRAGYRPGMELTITEGSSAAEGGHATPSELLQERLARLKPKPPEQDVQSITSMPAVVTQDGEAVG